MADVDFDDFDAGYGAPMARPQRVSRVVNLAGAASSVALVVGLGIWGYNLAVRDVNGVPVIRAMDGPMRIAPENPGGEVADHQGLAVNDVAAVGVAAPPPERLLLAPRPVELTEEDVAGLAGGTLPAADAARAPAAASPGMADGLAAPVAVAAVPLDGALAVSAPPPVTASAPLTAPDPQQGAVELALAEALSGGEDMSGTVETVPDATTGEAVAALSTDGGALRPRSRPASTSPASAAVAAAELDPATLTEGTRLVQLGAFDTPNDARAEWARLLNANPDLLAGKSLVVQSASSGGRDFFRLRAAGFANEDEARGLCSELLGRDATCIPVIHR